MPSDIIHTDLSETSKSLSVIGGFIVIYGLISFVVKERLYLSEPLLAVTVGIIVGPYVLNWIDPYSWGEAERIHELTYQFTRVVVGIQVLFAGISLPKAYLWREKLSITVLLFGIMTIAWFVTALLIWGLIPSITYLEALCIAAAVTPTDPVLANSITTGRFAEEHVPANVRNMIIAESGANDGLGFPFLFIALYLLARTGEDEGVSIGSEVGQWIYAVVIYQIMVSIAYGAVAGYLARKTLRWAEARSYIDKANFFAYGLGLAFFTLGTTGLIGSDDILACFIAGNSFTWDDWFRLRTEDNNFQEILDTILNMAVFVYIGTLIPWAAYSNPELQLTGWRVVVLAICVLLLRRPPWIMAATKIIPALRDYQESAFAGWFGPIGVSAVFYIEVAHREIPDDGTRDRLRDLYTPIVFFIIFGSVLTHGVTIPISKMGPGVYKRTTTLTQTRVLTFSRPNTIQSDIHPHRRPLNPFYSIASWLRHVLVFWEKDSFWRKEVKIVSKEVIGHPKDARTAPVAPQREEELTTTTEFPKKDEGADNEVVSPDGEVQEEKPTSSRSSRLPPPALEIPLSRTQSTPTVSEMARRTDSSFNVRRPPPAATRESAGHADGQEHPQGFGGSIFRALGRQLDAERAEAQDEAQRGWERGREREAARLRELQRQLGATAEEQAPKQERTLRFE